jgi:hypothetical protein
MNSSSPKRRLAAILIVVVGILGFSTAAGALYFMPQAHSVDAVGPDHMAPCARGWDMWLWGVSSDGSSGHGPAGGGEQLSDPTWDTECESALDSIKVFTITGASVGVLAILGLIAIQISTRRTRQEAHRDKG